MSQLKSDEYKKVIKRIGKIEDLLEALNILVLRHHKVLLRAGGRIEMSDNLKIPKPKRKANIKNEMLKVLK